MVWRAVRVVVQMTGVYATSSMEEMKAAVERLTQGGNVVEFPADRFPYLSIRKVG